MNKLTLNFQNSMTKRAHFSSSKLMLGLLIALLFYLPISEAEAKEIVAQSGSRNDVQAAIDAASPGDTIRIPAGSFSYGAEEVILKSDITITGTGNQETILHRDVDAGWVGIFRIKGGNNITVKNIQLFGLNSPSASKDDFGIYISGDLKDFRIANCRFQYMSRGIAIEGADVSGVIDHCKFYDIYRPAIANLGYGVAPVGRTWTQDIQWGGPDALFIEDCEFYNMRHAVSAGSGTHYVFRHNHTTKNTPNGENGDAYYHGWTAVDSHGGGYSDGFGTRAAEIYDNILETEIQGEESGGAINIRGGDAIIFNNTIKRNYNDGISLTIEGGTDPESYSQIHDTWIWNNTIDVPGRDIVNSYPEYIVLGEDYHLEQKPGYTPYTYPHPLTSGGQTTPPAAPSNLTATAASSSQINLSWKDNANNEDGFKIERRNPGGTFAQIATANANATTYQNTVLTANTTYEYQVRAHNTAGDSGYSNTASAKTLTASSSHPYVVSNQSDFDRIKQHIAAGENHWKKQYDTLTSKAASLGPNPSNGYWSTSDSWDTIKSKGDSGAKELITLNLACILSDDSGTCSKAKSHTLGWATQTNLDVIKSITSQNDIHAVNSVILDEALSFDWIYNRLTTAEINQVKDWLNNAGNHVRTVHNPATRCHNKEAWDDVTLVMVGLAIDNADMVNYAMGYGSYYNSHMSIKRLTDCMIKDNGNLCDSHYGCGEFWHNMLALEAFLLSSSGAARNGYENLFATQPKLSAALDFYAKVYKTNNANQLDYAGVDFTQPDSISDWNWLFFSGIYEIGKRHLPNSTSIKEVLTASQYNYYGVDPVGNCTDCPTTPEYNQGIPRYCGANPRNQCARWTRYPGLIWGEDLNATPTPPAAPTNLTATAYSATQINLSWTDNADNEDSYYVERRLAGGSWSAVGTTGSNVTTYQDTGLTANTIYYYRVKAYNAAGDSGYSNEANATTPTAPVNPPIAPSNLTATAQSSSQINLSWTDNSNNEDGFKIERRNPGGTFAQIATAGANATTYQNTGLTANTTYEYQVRAYNGNGDSGYSNTASATTQTQPTGPNAPSNLTATAASASQINLSWTDNSTNESGFKIERSTNATSGFSQITVVGANITSYQNVSLVANTTYYYRVRAYNAAGDSAYSNTASATTQTSQAAATPLKLIENNYAHPGEGWDNAIDGDTQDWDGTVTANDSPPYAIFSFNDATTRPVSKVRMMTDTGVAYEGRWVTQFTVQVSTTNTNSSSFTPVLNQVKKSGGNWQDYTINPTANAKYIKLILDQPNSGYRQLGEFEVYAGSPIVTPTIPAAPTNLAATAKSSSQIDLSWTDNANNEDGFKIERSINNNTGFSQIATVGAGVTAYSDYGLSANTRYYYRVKAYNAAGDSGYSNEANATTPTAPVNPPIAPSNLTATAQSSSQINLSWTDNSNNEDGFKIERRNPGGTFAQIATAGANATTYQNTGLTANTTYEYQVRAYNGSGDSGYSNTASATTPSSPPPDDTAFEQRKKEFDDEVIRIADRTFVNCQDYSEGNGVVLLSRNNLWPLLEQDKYPKMRECMIKNMLYSLQNNLNCWEEVDSEIHNKCGLGTVAILEESKTNNPNDEDGNGNPDWYDHLDDTQGFFMSVQYDNSLIFRLLYQYPDKLSTNLKQEIEREFREAFISGEDNGCFQISTNPNQRIQSAVGIYLWLERHPEDRNITFTYKTGGCAHYGTWEDFSCGGRSYKTGGTYNIWQFAQDYLNCVAFDNFGKGKGNYTNEFDATYSHPYFIALNALYDLAQDATIETKAKMSLDTFSLDYLMDYGADQHCGLRGRGAYYTHRLENSLAYIWYGLSADHSDPTPAPFPSPDVYTGIYRPPTLLKSLIDISGKADNYWRLHKENDEELNGGDLGKGTYITKYYGLGGAYGGYLGGWRLSLKPKANCGVNVYVYTSDAVVADPKDDLSGGAAPFYHYKYAAFTPSGKYIYVVPDCDFDIDEEKSGWRFLKLDKTMAAIQGGAMEAAIEGVDYSSYQNFKNAVLSNAHISGGCFTTSRGDILCSSANMAGTINGQPLQQFPFERMETETSEGKLIDWDNNVMTVTNGTNTCTYNFNNWTYSGDCGQVPVGPTIPAAPSNLTASAVSSSQINLSWTDNSGNEDGFKIERSTDGTNFSQLTTVNANVTSHQNTGLTASTKYYYRVRAYNAAGDSGYSNTASATTQAPQPTVPTAPSNLTTTAVSSSQINLAWTDNSANEDGFKIERGAGANPTSWSEIATVTANVTTYQNTGLTADTTYSYRVRAYNAAGNSGYSNTASATTQAAAPTVPAAPSNLTASAVSASQINLSWTDNSNNEDGFKIERKTGSGAFNQIATVGAGVTSYQNNGLTADTTYDYRVRAYNTAGDSGYSNTASATTQAAQPATPSAPSNLTATAASTNQINLSWQDNSDNESGFKIERGAGSNPSSFTQITVVSVNVTSYSNTSLTTNTAYTYRVRAYNNSGNSEYSNLATATTLAQGAGLSAPSNLTATAISDTQIDLKWTDNSSNEQGFKIERGTGSSPTSWSQIATVGANATSYQNTGLSAGTTYTYRVKAYSGSENSAYSNSATASTASSTPPAAPSNLVAKAVSSSQIDLTWTDNSNDESGFKIERGSGADPTSWSQITVVGKDVTSYSNKSLTKNTTYSYRVRAYNKSNSEYSNKATATTAP